MKIGIVYYSRTGNTNRVAKILEEKLKRKNAEVDLIEIENVKRPGFFAAGKAATRQLELPIKNTNFNMEKYEMILIGCPTWAGKPSPYITTFINKAENMKEKKIGIFGTGMSPITAREKFKEIIRNNLEKAGMKTFDSYVALQFTRGKLVDGEQNIDGFVNTVLKMKNG